MRTFPLVAVASCGFVQATESILASSPEGQARIIEGLITGIGFIGGGAIIKQGGAVQGTATAAGLWATGAIGDAPATSVDARALREALGEVVFAAATDESRPILTGVPQPIQICSTTSTVNDILNMAAISAGGLGTVK